MKTPPTTLTLGDFNLGVAPKTGTDGGRDLGPGHPQDVDRAQLAQDATEHPALAPADTSEGERRAGVALDAGVQAARDAAAEVVPVFVHDPIADIAAGTPDPALVAAPLDP